MLNFNSFKYFLILVFTAFCFNNAVLAQSSTATLTGSVFDEREAAIPGATVKVVNTDAGFERTVTTNGNGTFTVPLLPPATYRVTVERDGFAPFEVSGVLLNANDQKSISINLKVGQVGESVQVTAEAPLINESPAVGTTIDREFINNLPLNGRSLQTLIALSPGVVPAVTNSNTQGQFSVNGQRASANNFTVDGISGNFSASNFDGGKNGSGSIPTTSITGSFASLVSVEALKEFTIQTSTVAPEFGRSPGAQITLVTRSGENKFHGSLFEFFRNDKMDARDYFDTVKPPLRYNNYGGSLGGPIVLPRFGDGTPYLWKGKDKSFFFFSYEGQRFVLPQPSLNITVPSLATRNAAPNDIARQILNAYPLPNGADIRNTAGTLTGGAIYTASFSNPSQLDNWNLRIDHNLNKNFTLFGRFNYTPSYSKNRATTNPSTYQTLEQTSQTFTLGSTQVFGSEMANEVRANYSHNKGFTGFTFDGYGGGVLPSSSIFLPPSTAGKIVRMIINPISNITSGATNIGSNVKNENRQYQIVDNFSLALGSHQLKFGGDYRLLLPVNAPVDLAVYLNGSTLSSIYANVAPTLVADRTASYVSEFKAISFYGQDSWKVNKRMSMTYGLRWEINPAPWGRGSKVPVTLASAPDLSKMDQSSLTLAPIGTRYYETSYTNFAPRFGLSYLFSDKSGRELVVRGGIGIYYDLGQSAVGGITFPNATRLTLSNVSLPVTDAMVKFPEINYIPSPTNRASVSFVDPNFVLPRTYQWNLTAEQSLGKNQAISVAYVAALGRKLTRVRSIILPASATNSTTYFSPNFSGIAYIDNAGYSSYHSMQVQYKRRLTKGLQAIANFTWSHSIDNASNDIGFISPGYVFDQNVYRGDSDFDVRNNFSGAVSYLLPMPKLNSVSDAILRGWSLNSVFSARSGLPYNLTFTEIAAGFGVSVRRPNLITGVPLYIPNTTGLLGYSVRLNPAAFDYNIPVGQMGSLGRNAVRGFEMLQFDLSLTRSFNISEKVKLRLTADAFNVLNHPNFLYPTNTGVTFISGRVTVPSNYGLTTQTASRTYGGGSTGGGFNPLFQIGGPRSMQFSFRLSF